MAFNPAGFIPPSATRTQPDADKTRAKVNSLPYRPVSTLRSASVTCADVAKVSGTSKPARVGRNKAPVHSPYFFSTWCVADSSSGSELEDGSSYSEGDLGEGFHRPEYGAQSAGSSRNYFNEDHRLESMRHDLLKHVTTDFQAWAATVRFTEPPGEKLRVRERDRTTNQPSPCPCLREDEDQSDPELVVISHHSQYVHLACPYYISDPEKYRPCLLRQDLRTIKDVIRHLRRHHSKPPFCPMCYLTFGSYGDRDEHILLRTCEMRDDGDVNGINEYQKVQLVKRDKPRLDIANRWYRIWDIVFPQKGPPLRSPYLETDCERAISMVRDYWRNGGKYFVTQHLVITGQLHGDQRSGEKAQVAMESYILKDLLTRTYEEYRSA